MIKDTLLSLPIVSHIARLKQLHTETLAAEARIHQVICKEISITEFFSKGGHTSMTIEGGLVHLLSGIYIQAFKEHGAINHLMVDFTDRETNEMYALTVTKVRKLTPRQKADKIKKDILDVLDDSTIEDATRARIIEALNQ